MKKINYLVYPGNKKRFVPILIELLDNYNLSKYSFYELFGGSGVFSLTLSYNTNIKNILLNEKDINIYKIHYAFKNGTFNELNNIINEVWNFGNPKENKEDYYKARTELNKKYFNNNLHTHEFYIKSGFYNWVISTFAINSMVRFGPNGFNQGWGNRGIGRENPSKGMNNKLFNKIQKAYQKIDLSNKDYSEFIKNDKNIIYFVDPPYINKKSGTYDFNETDYNKFILNIKDLHNVIYTDVFHNNTLNKLGNIWDYKLLRENMGVGKPGLKEINNHKIEKEVIYYNLDIIKNKSLF